MRDGQGFAKLVTLENLESFAPLLQRAGRGEGAVRGGRQRQTPANPELEAAEGLFGGTSIRVRRPRAIIKSRRQERTREGRVETVITLEVVPIGRGPLVWRKQNLRPTDAQRQTGNVTGVLRLAQAKFRVNGEVIDNITYFRNTLFGGFNWRRVQDTPEKYSTSIRFDITILGTSYGVRELAVSHQPSRISGQGNVPTVLHWGDLTQEVRRLNVIGRTFNLYAPEEGTTEPFFIEIV